MNGFKFEDKVSFTDLTGLLIFSKYLLIMSNTLALISTFFTITLAFSFSFSRIPKKLAFSFSKMSCLIQLQSLMHLHLLSSLSHLHSLLHLQYFGLFDIPFIRVFKNLTFSIQGASQKFVHKDF